MRVPRKLALLGAGAVGVAAIGVSVPAFASGNDSPSPAPSSSSSAPAPKPDHKSDWQEKAKQARADRQEKLAAALAKELGIDQKKVGDALTKVRKDLAGDAKAQRADQLKDRLAKAVKAGKLTQAQADAIIAAAEKGVLNGAGGHGWGGWQGHGGHDWK